VDTAGAALHVVLGPERQRELAHLPALCAPDLGSRKS
jgi:hypothetical protein